MLELDWRGSGGLNVAPAKRRPESLRRPAWMRLAYSSAPIIVECHRCASGASPATRLSEAFEGRFGGAPRPFRDMHANSRHKSLMPSPSSRRPMKRTRSSSPNILSTASTPPVKAGKCYPCVRYKTSHMSRVGQSHLILLNDFRWRMCVLFEWPCKLLKNRN